MKGICVNYLLNIKFHNIYNKHIFKDFLLLLYVTNFEHKKNMFSFQNANFRAETIEEICHFIRETKTRMQNYAANVAQESPLKKTDQNYLL